MYMNIEPLILLCAYFFFIPLAPIITFQGMCLLVRHSTPTNPTPTPTPTPTPAATTATDTGKLNPTSSLTNTTAPGKNSADRITAAGSTSLIFAALAAFIL